MQTIKLASATIQYPETVGSANGQVIAKPWESADRSKSRVYFDVKFRDGGYAKCGYVDCVTGVKYLSSQPVSIARNLDAETTVQIS